MATQIAPLEGHPARDIALGPYVQRIRAFCLRHPGGGADDSQVQVRLGDRVVALEAQEFALLTDSAASGGGSGRGETLPLEILSLLAKCVRDLAQLRASTDPTSRSVYELQAELMLDSALGTVLLHETQSRIDVLIAAGDVEVARGMSQLRHRLRHAVGEVAKRIADSERRRVGGLAASLSDEVAGSVTEVSDVLVPPSRGSAGAARPPKISTSVLEDYDDSDVSVEIIPDEPAGMGLIPSSAAVVEEPRQPVNACRPARQRRPQAPAVAKPATARRAPSPLPGLALGGLTALWALLTTFAVPDATPPAAPDLRAFQRTSLLTGVTARPPSLFVEVGENAWQRLDRSERESFVLEVSRHLSGQGFTGAFVKTDSGRPVALWLGARGVSLLEPDGP